MAVSDLRLRNTSDTNPASISGLFRRLATLLVATLGIGAINVSISTAYAAIDKKKLTEIASAAFDRFLTNPDYTNPTCDLDAFLNKKGLVIHSRLESLLVGDRITAVDGVQIDEKTDSTVQNLFRKHAPTDRVTVSAKRGKMTITSTQQCRNSRSLLEQYRDIFLAVRNGQYEKCVNLADQQMRDEYENFWAFRFRHWCADAAGQLTPADIAIATAREWSLGLNEWKEDKDILERERPRILEAIEQLDNAGHARLAADLERQLALASGIKVEARTKTPNKPPETYRRGTAEGRSPSNSAAATPPPQTFRPSRPSMPARSSGLTRYTVEHSINDEWFVIQGSKFNAQTYCFNVSEGDSVIFLEGNAAGACATAKFYDENTSEMCEVWCE